MHVDAGDTAWVLGSAALVLFMTPGLALFYGGMVRSKNVLAMMVQNLATIAIVSIVWAVAAYSLAFGPDAGGGLIGTLHLAGLAHPEAPVPGLHLTVPRLAFAGFQMMFAVITAALLTGTGADRMRFAGFLAFAAIWTLVVYAPIAHWVFSPEGWLAQRGVLDFAGGNVVEIDSGASALALAWVLGPGRGRRRGHVARGCLRNTARQQRHRCAGAVLGWWPRPAGRAGPCRRRHGRLGVRGPLARRAARSTHHRSAGLGGRRDRVARHRGACGVGVRLRQRARRPDWRLTWCALTWCAN